MDQRQVDLVRASFTRLPQDAEAVGMLFYAVLFKIDPELRPLFKGDLSRQSALLVTMIATAVDNLDRLELVLAAVRDLGRRHARYGVKDVDYDTVETALLLTLGSGQGPVSHEWRGQGTRDGRGLDGHGPASRERLRHRFRADGLDSDKFGLRAAALHRSADAADKPAAPDRDEDVRQPRTSSMNSRPTVPFPAIMAGSS